MTARTICRHVGCNALSDAHGLCTAHQGDRGNAGRSYDRYVRPNDPALLAAARLRSSSAWKKLERLHKDLNPQCCDPFRVHGKYAPMTEASHHIVPLAVDISRGLDYDNLAPLCVRCHNRVEGMERAGKDAAGLFLGWKNVEITIGF